MWPSWIRFFLATEWTPLFRGYAASQSSMSLGLAGAIGAEQLDLV